MNDRRRTWDDRGRLAAALLAVAAAAWPGAADAYQRAFSAGALIIPAQQEYQTDCGMTSAYGLVYAILLKNEERILAGKKPITVYWVIEPRKKSHHRCDTDTDDLPSYEAFNGNDACDVAIQSAAGQPVALLGVDGAEIAPFTVDRTQYDAAKGESRRSGTAQIDASKKVVKYSGGFWVIDAADRDEAIQMMKTDALVNLWRNGCATCTTLPVAAGGCHFTKVHSARIGFTAPVARIMNRKPPLIGLIDGGNLQILQDYLQNSGLDRIPGAGGTFDNHGLVYDSLDPVTDMVSTTSGTPGILSAYFPFVGSPRSARPEYRYGAINATYPDSHPNPALRGKPIYYVLWAPHWELLKSTSPADGAKGDDAIGGGWTHRGQSAWDNARANLAHFASQGNGVYAQCAAIESLEGSFKSGTPSCACTDGAGNALAKSCPVGFQPPIISTAETCGSCYACPAGYEPRGTSCLEVKCVPVEPVSRCQAGFLYVDACGGCFDCDTACDVKKNCSNDTKMSSAMCPSSQPQCQIIATSSWVPAKSAPVVSSPDIKVADAVCSGTCVVDPSQVDVPGSEHTHFHATNGFSKNGLGNSFYNAPDCTDQHVTGKYASGPISGDCFDFHPDSGGPGNVYAQKGNFNYDGSSGSVHQYLPPAPVSTYGEGVMKFATFRNKSNPDRDGWDFATARHKDNDPDQGMVVYLAGHKYQNDAVGNRVALNTLLNLGHSDPAVEIARSEPVGYVTRKYDPDTKQLLAEKKQVFQGTYEQLPPQLGGSDDWVNYSPVAPHAWKFPYVKGHLRAYDVSSISTTKQGFGDNAEWDAATRLAPPSYRNLFTFLGGGGPLGWKAVPFHYTQTSLSTCVNSGKKDANGEVVCDLSEAIAACGATPGPGVSTDTLFQGDTTGKIRRSLGQFVQQVRGHCAAKSTVTGTAFYEPTDPVNQCASYKPGKGFNEAKLGGIDHSSPAVVGPSRYLRDTVAGEVVTRWSERPVIAYAGGRDGMLHAIYVSGAPWSAEGKSLPAELAPGTEIWAMIPPGQICGLATNSAMVDATLNVIDVFADFPRDTNGNAVIDWALAAERPDGIREWRTILVATTGGEANSNGDRRSEIFALDVTNPLRPVLLWHVDGKEQTGAGWDLAANKGDPAKYAMKWYDWDDGNAGTTHIPTAFHLSAPADLDLQKTSPMDYRNLGYSFGTAVGLVWEGNAFRYVLFVTSNAADWTGGTPLGFKGIEAFAMDIVTGRKLWQWEKLYRRTNAVPTSATGSVIADNEIPGRPALVDVDNDGSVDRVYVGDIEGRLWELSATTGRNLNYLLASDAKYHSFPLFGADPMTGGEGTTVADPQTIKYFTPSGSTQMALQPLTSPIGVGRLTEVPTQTPPGDMRPYLLNRIAVTQGTMGVGWSVAPFERGHVYVVPAFPEAGTRYETPVPLDVVPSPKLRGVVKPGAYWPIALAVGERVFGMPKIVGNDIFINTAFGSFTGDIAETFLDAGSTRRVNATGATEIMAAGKAFGGVLVMGNDVVISSASGMERKANSATPPPATTPDSRVRNRTTPTFMNTWEQARDADASYLEGR